MICRCVLEQSCVCVLLSFVVYDYYETLSAPRENSCSNAMTGSTNLDLASHSKRIMISRRLCMLKNSESGH